MRSFLITLSHNRTLRKLLEQTGPGRKVSGRFVAGTTLDDAIRVTEELNAEGFSVSLDSLGESVATEAGARAAAEIYHLLLDRIAAKSLNANVSVKLTGIGLDVSSALGEQVTAEIVEHAARLNNFVRIDMEGTPYTEVTLKLTEHLHGRFPGAVGTVLQAYLYRTNDDTERLLRQGIRIRLCKGAYKEGPEHAFPEKADVDRNYVKLAERMVSSDVYCGMATHDEKMISAVEQFVTQHGIAHDRFEFQMLFGVRRDLQRSLLKRGYRVRVYLPFGTDWYPYFMRRLAERPANVIFILKNLFKS
ncbi:proline dehydrogenase PutB [Terriglobus aquaticus]